MSVIVCTYNQARLLEYCLISLAQQQLDTLKFEVLVVNNNCTDDTSALVERYQARLPNLRMVSESNQGLSHARNRGYQEAQGSHLIYIDDDAQAPPDYLTRVYTVLQEQDPDILGGPIYPFYLEDKPAWFKDEYEIRQSAGFSGFIIDRGISGSNFIIKKELLPRLGLFDVTLGMIGNSLGLGEERKVLETYRAMTPRDQQKVYYDLGCQMLHYVPPRKMTLKYQIRRHYVSGRASVELKQTARNRIKAAKMIVKTPYFFAKLIIKEICENGLRKVDYLKILQKGALHLGQMVEASRRLVRPG